MGYAFVDTRPNRAAFWKFYLKDGTERNANAGTLRKALRLAGLSLARDVWRADKIRIMDGVVVDSRPKTRK